MDGYFDGTLGSTPCIKIVRTMGLDVSILKPCCPSFRADGRNSRNAVVLISHKVAAHFCLDMGTF